MASILLHHSKYWFPHRPPLSIPYQNLLVLSCFSVSFDVQNEKVNGQFQTIFVVDSCAWVENPCHLLFTIDSMSAPIFVLLFIYSQKVHGTCTGVPIYFADHVNGMSTSPSLSGGGGGGSGWDLPTSPSCNYSTEQICFQRKQVSPRSPFRKRTRFDSKEERNCFVFILIEKMSLVLIYSLRIPE